MSGYPTAPKPRPGDVLDGPDFAVLGAMKAGTTRLWALLRSHPQFFVDPGWDQLLQSETSRFRNVKERMFFVETGVEFGDAEVEQYRRWFARPQGTFCGDFTPYYLSSFWAPLQFKHAAPDAKLIVVLRDPIDRFISGVTHDGSTAPPVLTAQFGLGFYREQLARWKAYFPEDQFLVLQFEAMNLDPLAALIRVFEFVGMDPDYRPDPELLQKRINPGRERPEVPRHLLESLANGYREETLALLRECPELDPELWGDWLR